jgi:AAA-like domain
MVIESSFYVERPPVEAICKEHVLKRGGLIRIKAPRLMGKTSLINYTLAYAAEAELKTASWALTKLESNKMNNLEVFLYSFCEVVSEQLQIENRLDEFWDGELFSSNQNCSTYFEDYLLQQIKHGIVIALDDLDAIFEYPAVSADFLGLLRSWHEKSKDNSPWQKVRFVIAHSLEDYTGIDINQSPFNVGVTIPLEEFNQEQIKELTIKHGMDREGLSLAGQRFLNTLWHWAGGHPYLTRIATFYGARHPDQLDALLDAIDARKGIYGEYLNYLKTVVCQDATLVNAMREVVSAQTPVSLCMNLKSRLYSLGLVKCVDCGGVVARNTLYRQFFQSILS